MLTKGRIRAGAVLAGAIVVAIAVWVVTSSGNDPKPAGSAALSVDRLIADVQRLHTPVYWVGPLGDDGYEFDATSGGRTYVRYLPRGVKAGDPRPDFLTVGTYKLPHPMADLRKAARERGGETVRLPHGAVAFMDRYRPAHAFIVGRHWNAQVEVYDPKPGRAMELVLRGDVQPIR